MTPTARRRPHVLSRYVNPPWMEPEAHAEAVRIAERVALDMMRHHRFGAGNEGQPVYDLSDGRYLGNQDDDQVRCRVGGPIVVINNRDVRRVNPAMSHVERVYRLIVPSAVRWADLRDVLDAATTLGLVEADEPVERAATRAFFNGYTAAALRGFLLPQGVDPVGTKEIAARTLSQPDTVDQWRRRDGTFPAPRWTTGGRPTWNWPDVYGWLVATGRGRMIVAARG